MDSATQQSWSPTEALLKPLIAMGINENAAIKGLFYTGNSSVDAAASWVLDNGNDATIDLPMTESISPSQRMSPVGSSSEGDAVYKMVFIVNTELKMGVGKIAAQVAHACHALHKILIALSSSSSALKDWEETGTTKIVLSADSAATLMELEEEAKAKRIANYLVIDAGRTQIAPSSVTVLGLFGRSSDVDTISGQLKLL